MLKRVGSAVGLGCANTGPATGVAQVLSIGGIDGVGVGDVLRCCGGRAMGGFLRGAVRQHAPLKVGRLAPTARSPEDKLAAVSKLTLPSCNALFVPVVQSSTFFAPRAPATLDVHHARGRAALSATCRRGSTCPPKLSLSPAPRAASAAPAPCWPAERVGLSASIIASTQERLTPSSRRSPKPAAAQSR